MHAHEGSIGTAVLYGICFVTCDAGIPAAEVEEPHHVAADGIRGWKGARGGRGAKH